jgi:pyrimidine operon attenuation protein/uracil phosphoribosyltransferase
VGKNLPTARAERVNVRVEELDGIDEVTISTASDGGGDAIPPEWRPTPEKERV